MKKSNLNKEMLRKIWIAAASTNNGYLTKYEFFFSLKLIALVQNKVPIEESSFRNPSYCFLPVFSQAAKEEQPVVSYEITPSDEKKFGDLFDKFSQNKNSITEEELNLLMTRHAVPQQLSDYCKQLVNFKGYRHEFIALIKLVNTVIKHKQNVTALPLEIINYLSRNEVKIVKPVEMIRPAVIVQAVNPIDDKRSSASISDLTSHFRNSISNLLRSSQVDANLRSSIVSSSEEIEATGRELTSINDDNRRKQKELVDLLNEIESAKDVLQKTSKEIEVKSFELENLEGFELRRRFEY